MPSLLDRMIAGMIPMVPRPLVRRISSRYIAGEDTAQVMSIAKHFGEIGLRCTMDILGEHTMNRERAAAATQQYLELVRRQVAEGVDRNISIKLTQLGLKVDRGFCLENMRSIAALTAETDTKIRIDMEDSSCTDDTLWIFRRLREDHDHIGVVLQAYLHRSERDVQEMLDLRPDYRLCKGIYLEAPEIAIEDPAEINRNFLRLLERMFEGGSYVGVATHDEALVDGALALIEKLGLDSERYEFQMLLGVTEPLRDRLRAAGHPVRIYLPYGQEWYAYCVRRLKENPSIAGHVFRAMFSAN